jgi:hypothetical protein
MQPEVLQVTAVQVKILGALGQLLLLLALADFTLAAAAEVRTM